MTEPVPPSDKRGLFMTRKRLALFSGLAIVLLLVVVALVYDESRREERASDMVTHTLFVLKKAIELENVVLAMEASQRGFLISGKPYLLANRDASHDQAIGMIDELLKIAVDNPSQSLRLRQSRIELDARYSIMKANGDYALETGLDAARLRFNADGKGSIEPIRKILAEVRLEENRLLASRLDFFNERREQSRWMLGISTLIAFAILLACGFVLFRQLALGEQVALQLEQSAEQLRFAYEVSRIGNWELNLKTGKTNRSLLHDQIFGHSAPLEDWGYDIFTGYVHPDDLARVDAEFRKSSEHGAELDFECRIFWPDRSLHWIAVHGRIFETRDGDRSRMLGTIADITERKEAEQAISKLNRELMARTTELQASNQDLESFSYSVSHDLRAPLRHIDGYARMLSEDAADHLAPESRRYLDTIIASARRMGMLIDDLLTFSRLGRKPLTMQNIDMNDLVTEVLNDIEFDRSGNTTHIALAPLPAANGDPALLRQVWVNLLSNAIKYSAPKGSEARIEIGGVSNAEGVHYWVKDNGVGFEMKYADKLFGVFQRMHPQDQFEGTGVGLAIVHRIIARHGGRVSATAEKNKGASFSFDLPVSEVMSE